MRDYGKVEPSFWTGETGRKIRSKGADAQLLALYLLTNPHANMIGLYYLPVPFMAHETAIPFEGASKALQSLIEAGFCAYDRGADCVWVFEMARHQIGEELKPNDNRVKNINKVYSSLPKCTFLKEFYEKYKNRFHLSCCRESSPLEAPSKPLRSQEQEQEQKQEQEKPNMSGSKPDDLDPENDHPESASLIDPTEPTEKPKPASKPVADSKRDVACRAITYLNRRAGKNFQPTQANVRLVLGRLNEGFTPEQIKSVIDRKTLEWRNDPERNQYLRPATLFNATKFSQYVGDLDSPLPVPAGEKTHETAAESYARQRREYIRKNQIDMGAGEDFGDGTGEPYDAGETYDAEVYDWH